MVYDSHDTDTVRFRKQKLTIIFENVKHSLVHKDDTSSLQLAKKLEAQAFARSDNNREAYTSLIDESIKRLKTQYSKSEELPTHTNKMRKKESSLTYNHFLLILKNLITILNRYDGPINDKIGGNDTGSHEMDVISMGTYLETLVHFICPMAYSSNYVSIEDNEENIIDGDNISDEADMIASYANDRVKVQITQSFELWQTLKSSLSRSIRTDAYKNNENKEKDMRNLVGYRLMVRQIHLLLSTLLRCYIPSIVLSKYPMQFSELLSTQQLMHVMEEDWN